MAAAAFDDLQPCTLFPSDWGTLAVGWLAKDRPFAKGPVAPELLRALHRLGQPSWSSRAGGSSRSGVAKRSRCRACESAACRTH